MWTAASIRTVGMPEPESRSANICRQPRCLVGRRDRLEIHDADDGVRIRVDQPRHRRATAEVRHSCGGAGDGPAPGVGSRTSLDRDVTWHRAFGPAAEDVGVLELDGVGRGRILRIGPRRPCAALASGTNVAAGMAAMLAAEQGRAGGARQRLRR